MARMEHISVRNSCRRDLVQMISVTCVKCRKELDLPGAIVLSPPTENYEGKVWKYHVCFHCWAKLEKWLRLS
jgi:hypothetical protein